MSEIKRPILHGGPAQIPGVTEPSLQPSGPLPTPSVGSNGGGIKGGLPLDTGPFFASSADTLAPFTQDGGKHVPLMNLRPIELLPNE